MIGANRSTSATGIYDSFRNQETPAGSGFCEAPGEKFMILDFDPHGMLLTDGGERFTERDQDGREPGAQGSRYGY